MQELYTSCRFCNTGCGFKVSVGPLASFDPALPDLAVVPINGGNGVEFVPDVACPANSAEYSVRGAFLAQSLYRSDGPTSDRLLHPMIRNNGTLTRASWDDALGFVADKLGALLKQDGPQSIGFYHADWFGGENAYGYIKLAQLLGIHNYDLNGRLCAASGSAGMTRSLGKGSHPYSYQDIDAADVVFLAGANASGTLSVIYDRIFTNAQSGAVKLIVTDVRRTLPAQNAEQLGGTFLQLRPGTDVALYNAIGNVLITESLTDQAFIQAHTNGFDAYRTLVTSEYSPESASKVTGIPADTIRQVARTIGKSKATLFLSGKGLEQQAHGVTMISSLVNLALLTGNMGKPGGSCSPLGGHQGSVKNPPMFAGQLGNITIPNKTIFEMLDQMQAGTQKALLCSTVNPLVTLPDLTQARAALKKLELLAVTEIYPTQMTELAHVVFPAATYGEIEGTSDNSDRRVRFYEAFMPAPGEAKADWEVPAGIGRKLGYADQFPWKTSEDVFNELKGTSGDLADLTYARMRAAGSTQFQLPLPKGSSTGTVRLYADGIFPTPDGKARIWADRYQPQAEPPSADYPFVLVTGRTNDLWQSGYTFKRTPHLVKRLPQNTAQINPHDASRLGISTGQKIRIHTRRGQLDITAEVTDNVQTGTVFTLWGYPGSPINNLTINARDPISQQPSYKGCAANIETV